MNGHMLLTKLVFKKSKVHKLNYIKEIKSIKNINFWSK